MASNNSCWLPLGLCALVLILLYCGSGSSNSATRLQQKNDGSSGNMEDQQGPAPPTGGKKLNSNEQGEKERKEIRNKVLSAHLDNYSSGFVRLGKKTKKDGTAYYPQIQHYFRTNENSFESIVQKRQKKRFDPSAGDIPRGQDEAEQQL